MTSGLFIHQLAFTRMAITHGARMVAMEPTILQALISIRDPSQWTMFDDPMNGRDIPLSECDKVSKQAMILHQLLCFNEWSPVTDTSPLKIRSVHLGSPLLMRSKVLVCDLVLI